MASTRYGCAAQRGALAAAVEHQCYPSQHFGQAGVMSRSAANCCEHVEVQGPPDHDAASSALLYAAVLLVLLFLVRLTASWIIPESSDGLKLRT